jgi:CubicO group peptidase (beta-lactamase class C family)
MMIRLPHHRLCAALLLAAITPPASAQTRPSDAQLAERADAYLQRLASRGYTGGVLIVRHGHTVFSKAYGLADRERGVAADTSTVWNLGSITKQFTAAAILRLEEMGRLRTSDAIARFFPDAPTDKRGITLHQLLTHTAGFRSDFSPTDYEPTARAEYVARMFAAPLRTPPGAAFSYANSGYSLLAAIVEQVTGQSYEDALRALVLLPAGMTQTGYTAPQWAPARIAHGYQDGRDWGTIVQRISVPGAPFWALRGNGGLHTTLGDMARWDAALTDARVLSDSSRRKFMTGYVNEGPAGLSQYAYGWAVMQTARKTRLVTHNGGNGVYVAELLRFVDEGVTIFSASTVSDLTASMNVRTLSRIAFGETYELPPARVAASASAMAAAEGTWQLADGSRLTLRGKNGALEADAVGQQAWQLLATGDTTAPPQAAVLNARAAQIVEALGRGDIGPLRVALGTGGPDSAEVAAQEGELLASRRERFGAWQQVEVLGTTAGAGGLRRTTVRITFTRGQVTNLYTWEPNGTIADIGARPFAPIEIGATDSGEFRSWDPRTGGGVRLVFTARGGDAMTPKGRVTLTRVR